MDLKKKIKHTHKGNRSELSTLIRYSLTLGQPEV